jgi:hypothetical protein
MRTPVVYFGHHLVVRTRSRVRALRALVARLDGHLDSTRTGRLLVGGRALVRDDAVVLVAEDFATDLDALEPRFRRLGIAICDAPSVELPGSGKVVLTAPTLAVDEGLLATLDGAGSAPQELGQPAPGARPLRGWVVPSRLLAGSVAAPDALRAIVATVRNLDAFGSAAALALVGDEIAHAPVQATPRGEPEMLFDEVVALLGG